MTREEDLIRIAKKLDKMVSRNNTVRLFWHPQVARCPATSCCAQGPWMPLVQVKRFPSGLRWRYVSFLFANVDFLLACTSVTWAWLHCNKRPTGVWRQILRSTFYFLRAKVSGTIRFVHLLTCLQILWLVPKWVSHGTKVNNAACGEGRVLWLSLQTGRCSVAFCTV